MLAALAPSAWVTLAKLAEMASLALWLALAMAEAMAELALLLAWDAASLAWRAASLACCAAWDAAEDCARALASWSRVCESCWLACWRLWDSCWLDWDSCWLAWETCCEAWDTARDWSLSCCSCCDRAWTWPSSFWRCTKTGPGVTRARHASRILLSACSAARVGRADRPGCRCRSASFSTWSTTSRISTPIRFHRGKACAVSSPGTTALATCSITPVPVPAPSRRLNASCLAPSSAQAQLEDSSIKRESCIKRLLLIRKAMVTGKKGL